MNKKFLSAILFGALMVTSTGTFVSCKDYDDDIDSLQGQVDTNVSAIDALKSQLSSLQTAGSAAQATADAAKAAADAAKKAGDDAKAAAEEAKAAAAQAKADAIAEAANQVAALKAIVEANKLSQDQLQTLIATVSGKVEAIDADINELKGLVTTEDGKTLADIAAVVADLEEQIAALQAGGVASEEIAGLIESLQGQLNTVTGNVWTLIEDVDAIMTAIAGNQENVDAAIADLNQRLANSYGELDELWAEINGEGANSIRTQMGQLANLINDLQTQYNTLSVLVAPQLASLTFMPYEIFDGVEGLTYGSFSYKALTLTDKDNKDGKEKATEANKETLVAPAVLAKYKVSPKGIDVEALKEAMDFTLITDAKYKSRAASSKGFDMTPEFVSYDATTGVLTLNVKVAGEAATEDDMTMFALEVNGVTSDYAVIRESDMDDIEIADEKLAKDIDNHYRRAIKGINGVDDEAYIADVTAWESPEDVEVDTTLVYNDTKGLDLNTIVTAHAVGSECTVADIEKYGFAWKFEVVKNYGIGTPATPQEEFVTLSEAGVLTARVYETEGRAAIGRTPIIRVSLIDTNNNNAIVKCAYIKVRIIDSAAAPQEPVAVTMEVDPFEFDCAEDANGVTVKEINLKIYNELGLSYEQFLEAYPVFEDWGALQTPAHIGTVTPSDNSENPGEGTDVITWTITEQELWDNAGKEVTHIIRYYNDTKTNYVAFQLKSTIGGIQKKYNIAKADFISNYWNEAKEWTKFNVAVPSSTTDEDPANCTFINNLNAPFTTWAANSTEGVPGILKLDKNVKDIEFYFCKEVADIKKIGDINVIFSISEDGLTLYGKKKAADTPQTIATINNEDATWGNVVTYNKESDLAKELLNAGPAAMYTYIGAKGYVCGQNAKEVTITFDGKDHFQANFIRPVNIAEKAADNFIDGVDVGEKGSFIRLEDLIDPYDWRDRYFKDYKNYWGYYGEFKVEVDTENAECNLNGVTQAVPVTVVLEQSDATSMGDGADKKESKYGFLTYKNNGTKVSEFEIYVKVKVTYGWGVIETKPITVKVASTITKE